MTKKQFFILLPLLAIISATLLSGCPNNNIIMPTRNLQDTEPPHFENLIFPVAASIMPCDYLLISGTLVDTADEGEPGFDEDCPVYLEIETLGTDSAILRNTHFCAKNPDENPLDPCFFDYETGDFVIEFGDYRRMKPGIYNLRLIGVDASGNQSDPIESGVAVAPCEGIDPQIIYDARDIYGVLLIGLLESYIACLNQYGELYYMDVNIINEFIAYIDSTYIDSPKMDTWYEQACILHDNVSAIPYPDPIVHAALLEGLRQFKEQIPLMVELKAGPFYPVGATAAEIVEYHNAIPGLYMGDIMSVENPYQGNPFATHYYFLAYNFFHDEQMTEIADFVVTADPEGSLLITGTIGSDASWYTIEPGDYDNPIELFGLFGGAGLNFHLVKYW